MFYSFFLQGVRIYAVQCSTGLVGDLKEKASEFWKELAVIGHGEYLWLDQFSTMVDMFMAICFREAGAEFFEVNKIICL